MLQKWLLKQETPEVNQYWDQVAEHIVKFILKVIL